MKKIALILFAAVFLIVFTGCGKTSDAGSGTTSETGSNDTAVMTSFSATTIEGGTFTEEDLASHDLTMVNIWTTWCGYCVLEMPELQEVYDNLPDNVNMITVCADGNDEAGTAEDILEENGCTFTALIPDENLNDSLLSVVSAYPTTVFVDQDGNLVGDMQVGVPQNGNSTADAYLSLIDDKLDQLNLK